MALAELLVERFEVEHRISGGSMGEVFRGRDRTSGEAVAIKFLAEDSEIRAARFAREVELLAELSHPGIVRYIAHGQTPSGRLFLVMEWLDGEDLRHRLGREPLTTGEAITLITRVAVALGTPHARGIVHRDLKPSNLFLPGGRIDQVKILDFGIALKDGRTQLTRTGTMVGTPGYMAPEQVRSHASIDTRADVFALGCVLFQCLIGAPAFPGDSTFAVLKKILFDEAPRMRALWPEVPEDLDELVARMLAQDPALRPRDGADLAAALALLGPGAHSTAVAPRELAAPPSAMTGSERRLLSVVLLGGGAEGGAPIEGELAHVIKPYGARMEQLADGPTLVVFEDDRQVATDQAARAARCALAIRALAGDRPIALAMGRVESTRELPGDDVISRAFQMLARASSASPPVALDDMSAGLLDARFDVVESEAGLALHGERVLMQGARTLLGRPTSCVGRDWELSALAGILDECIDESEARAAIITAAAGMGKSRLGAEFVSRVQQRGEPVAIWVGRGDSLRAGSTLDLLAQALRSALGVHGGEPPAERRDQIRARVAERVRATERGRVAAFLGELVGAPFPDDDEAGAALRAARQDAQLMSEQTRRAWIDFLDAETSAHPILLVLEDLHWGDFGTVRFIDTALRDRGNRPWMVLALARPEVFEVFPKLWADRRNVQEIRLKELGRKAGERLVRQVLGDIAGPRMIERLVERAEGNALYLEELIRTAAEGKDDALPETVLAMVEARLDRLPIEARRVLRAASVFGEVCWERGVATLLGGAIGGAILGQWLPRLVEQEVLAARPSGRFVGEQELMFRHALLREGAYATLTEEDKRLGHRLAGEWLEQHGELDPMVLAGHFERGGQGERAARYYLHASEQAMQVLDLEATMARADLGLACEPPPELRLDLLGMRCEAALQNLPKINETLGDAEELKRSAPRGSLPWLKGMIIYNVCTFIAGRIEDLLASLALLREVDPAPDAARWMALAFLNGIHVNDTIGRLPDASALEQQFGAIARSTWDRKPSARYWWHLAVGMRASYADEDPWTGLVHGDAMHTIFEEIGGDMYFLNAQLFRGMNLWYLGALPAAEQVLHGIAAADVALGIVASIRRFCLAWLRADRNALAEARALAAQLSEFGHAYHLQLDEGRGRWVLAEVLRRIGDLDAAEREILPALELAIPIEAPGVLATLSALRLAQGRAEDALAAAADAMSRCTTMGGCGMFRGALVRLAHAEALHATGAHDAARHAITAARTRLLTTADRISDPAYKQSFLADVPENARTLALARAWLGDPAPGA